MESSNNELNKYFFYHCDTTFSPNITCHITDNFLIDGGILIPIKKSIPIILHKPLLYYHLFPNLYIKKNCNRKSNSA